MLEQITTVEGMVGKMIARAVEYERADTKYVGQVYSDGTFAVLAPYGSHDRYEVSVEDSSDHVDLAALGLISEDEFGRIEDERRAAREAANRAESQRRQAAWEESERRTYERLKVKFEGKGNA